MVFTWSVWYVVAFTPKYFHATDFHHTSKIIIYETEHNISEYYIDISSYLFI